MEFLTNILERIIVDLIFALGKQFFVLFFGIKGLWWLMGNRKSTT